jgi:long-chain acyl-CoA synthetase
VSFDALRSTGLGDVLREHKRSYPLRTAVVDGDHRATWPQLDERVTRLAGVLAGCGVGTGDRVLWFGQNSHRLLELLLAAAKLGAIACPGNWRSSADELAFLVSDLDPAVVVWQRAELEATVRAARALIDTSAAARSGALRWLCHDDRGPDGYEAELAAADPRDPGADVDPASPVLALYTGAFTGRPNAALLSHGALLTQALVMAQVQRVSCDDVYLNCGPLFHVATLMTTIATFVCAGSNVFTPRSDPEELCRLVEAERCTGAFLMPPTISKILELNRDGRFDLHSLRTFGGSPEWNAMITVDTSPWARHPAGYGQTEVMGMLTLNSWGGPHAGGAGRPGPLAQVRIVDPAGVEVPAGETGEIVARGPTVLNGFHARPELEEQRVRGGWYHTGDLGRREEDGSITFVAPLGRLIKSAAENIYPAEVEQCLATHPAVAEAAVIGVPDMSWGQSVTAVVVRNEGATVDEGTLIEHCRARLASYKKPRSVIFVDALPRDGWRVDYAALDAAHGGGGYPGAR